MPRVEVRFFRDERRAVPVLDWLEELRRSDRRGHAWCEAAIHRLAELGSELRRPHYDYVGSGIHELRIHVRRVQVRILYFFHGRSAVVLTHALTKEKRIPEIDLARAVARRKAFEADPDGRTHETRWTDA